MACDGTVDVSLTICLSERANAKAARLREKLDVARNEADARAAEMRVLQEHFAAQEAVDLRKTADFKTKILSLEAELALKSQQFDSLFAMYLREHGEAGVAGGVGEASVAARGN